MQLSNFWEIKSMSSTKPCIFFSFRLWVLVIRALFGVHFPFWNHDLPALCGCQVLLSFKPIRTCFFAAHEDSRCHSRHSGSASPPGPLTGSWSLMMDEQCPLAGFTSDQCHTTADACSAPRSAQLSSVCPPLTPHSLRGLLELSHHSTKEIKKIQLVMRDGRGGKNGGDHFSSHLHLYLISSVMVWHCQKMKECAVIAWHVSLPLR